MNLLRSVRLNFNVNIETPIRIPLRDFAILKPALNGLPSNL
jgi:hypothetical protein